MRCLRIHFWADAFCAFTCPVTDEYASSSFSNSISAALTQYPLALFLPLLTALPPIPPPRKPPTMDRPPAAPPPAEDTTAESGWKIGAVWMNLDCAVVFVIDEGETLFWGGSKKNIALCCVVSNIYI